LAPKNPRGFEIDQSLTGDVPLYLKAASNVFFDKPFSRTYMPNNDLRLQCARN
jgi:hypothetical protein